MHLHHVGLIVADIDYVADFIPRGKLINDVLDPIQDARLCLYENYGSSYLELIQPLSENSPTWNQLNKYSNHMNHFCYKLNDRDELDFHIKKLNLMKVSEWLDAILFPNHEVLFCYSRSRLVVEFIVERES